MFLKNVFEYIFFLGFSYFFRLIGINASRKFAGLLAGLFYYVIPIRKETVIANLKLAFPEYSEGRIKETAFGCYKSFAITLIEILCSVSFTKEDYLKSVEFKNDEMVLERYKRNKGIIIMTAHFGNWEMASVAFGIKHNITLYEIVKSQRNGYVSGWLNRCREKFGNKTINLGISIRQIYAALKEKHIVALVADQRASRESIRVDFFGQSTTVYEGPVVLSLKTGAPIIMGLVVRQKDYTYKVEWEEISQDNLPENQQEKIIELSQRHMRVLERYIRANPEQWLWMHKRWKY